LTSYSKQHGSLVETGTVVHAYITPLEWEQGEGPTGGEPKESGTHRHLQAHTDTHRNRLLLNRGKKWARGSYLKRCRSISTILGKAAGGKGYSGPITNYSIYATTVNTKPLWLLCDLLGYQNDKDQHTGLDIYTSKRYRL
jgi:hypothetical protein